MKIFTRRYFATLCLLSALLPTVSCSDEESPVVTFTDFQATFEEGLQNGDVIGTLEASADKGTVTFAMLTESESGAFTLNTSTGELTVRDASKFTVPGNVANKVVSAVVIAKSGDTKRPIPVKVTVTHVVWAGEDLTFSKESGADWTLPANQDKITDLVTLTRQNSGPLYNYQWWQINFHNDATLDDLVEDFWNIDESEREFTRRGGTQGVRWAILEAEGDNKAWDEFKLYGTLGDPAHFYSFHNIAAMLTDLDNNEQVIKVINDFSHEREDEVNEDEIPNMPGLVGKKLGVWLVEDDIYLTLTFNEWGSDGTNTVKYTRSTQD